jgi:hypothetical protein
VHKKQQHNGGIRQPANGSCRIATSRLTAAKATVSKMAARNLSMRDQKERSEIILKPRLQPIAPPISDAASHCECRI